MHISHLYYFIGLICLKINELIFAIQFKFTIGFGQCVKYMCIFFIFQVLYAVIATYDPVLVVATNLHKSKIIQKV